MKRLQLFKLLWVLVFALVACTPTNVVYITATPSENDGVFDSTHTPVPIETDGVDAVPTIRPTATVEPTPTREVLEKTELFRVSFNINARAVPDWNRLWDVLERLDPSTIFVMDGITEACQAQQRHPDAIVIHRNFSSFEGSEWINRPNEHEWVARWQGENNNLPPECQDIVRYLTNEPSFGDVAQWAQSEIEIMDASASAGIRVAAGNLGVGRLPDWAVNGGLLDEWLRAVVRGNHIIGAHEYAQPIIPNGIGVYSREQMVDAGAMHPDNWATSASVAYLPFASQNIDELDPVTSPFGEYQQALSALDAPILAQSVQCGGRMPPYWHVLRTSWLILRAECLEDIDANDLVIVNTEGLWDRTDDLNIPDGFQPIAILEERYGMQQYTNDMRGVNSYVDLYADWYPFWTAEEAIVCQLVWWDFIAPAQYIGVNLFAWNRNPDWWSFDFSGPEGAYLYDLHELLEYWATGGDMQAVCGDYAWAA